MKKRNAFTLIELIIAMAIFLIIVVMAFGTLSSFFSAKTANDQETIIQQNFRAAISRITDDLRQAGGSPIIVQPQDNSMGEILSFNITATSSQNPDVVYQIKPDPATSQGPYAIYRNDQPITEEMHQVVRLYFVRSGGKVLAIIVGELTYFGKPRRISFHSLIFSRNSSYEALATVSITPSSQSVKKNGSITWTITVENVSEVSLEKLTVVETLPSGFQCVSPDSFSGSGQIYFWDINDLAKEGKVTSNFTANVGSETGNYVNNVTLKLGDRVIDSSSATVAVTKK